MTVLSDLSSVNRDFGVWLSTDCPINSSASQRLCLCEKRQLGPRGDGIGRHRLAILIRADQRWQILPYSMSEDFVGRLYEDETGPAGLEAPLTAAWVTRVRRIRWQS